MDAELRQTLAEMRQETQELRQEFAQARQETHATFAEVRREMHELNAQTRRENVLQHEESRKEARHYFEVYLERMDHRYDALAEAFLALDERTDRRVKVVEQDVSELRETTPKMIEYAMNEHEKRRH